MTNAIDDKFRELKENGRKALIAYLTCGFPDMKTTGELACKLAASGADMLELGVPFSDPIADGPVIQYCSNRALEKNVSLKGVLSLAGRLKNRTGIPLLIMSYFNPIYRYGTEKFFRDCSENGVCGVVIPDMTIELTSQYRRVSGKNGVHLINFISSMTDNKRSGRILKESEGFVYVLSVAGVTGMRKSFGKDTGSFIARLRKRTGKPLAVGFGISKPEQAARLKKNIDGIIIGSAIMNMVINSLDIPRKKMYNRLGNFIKSFDKILRTG